MYAFMSHLDESQNSIIEDNSQSWEELSPVSLVQAVLTLESQPLTTILCFVFLTV